MTNAPARTSRAKSSSHAAAVLLNECGSLTVAIAEAIEFGPDATPRGDGVTTLQRLMTYAEDVEFAIGVMRKLVKEERSPILKKPAGRLIT
jgi:hypothetical protein